MRAVVSGSYKRFPDDIEQAVARLEDCMLHVLSPIDPRVVDRIGDFVFVASDRVRRIRTVQSRHLAGIAASDFVWLVARDGYVGTSAAMEVGYAVAREVPVFGVDEPGDISLREFVHVVADVPEAVRQSADRSRSAPLSVLVDPVPTIQKVHDDLVVAQRVGVHGVSWPGPGFL